MKLNVDTKIVKENYNKLDEYINAYRDNCYDMFYDLSKLDSYWKGEDASSYMEKVNNVKSDNNEVITSLEKLSNFYKEVDSYYDNISNDEK